MLDIVGWLLISFEALIGVLMIFILSLVHPIWMVMGILWIGCIMFWLISAQLYAEYRYDLPCVIKNKIKKLISVNGS